MPAPNVLFIMADQLAARALQLYGGACETPALAALAQRGLLFERTYTPHPLCVPARIATWTACWSHRTGQQTNQSCLPAAADTALNVWKEAGYTTALIGKNHCFDPAASGSLFDVWCEITHTGIPEGARTRGLPWPRPGASIAEAHRVRQAMPDTGGPVSHAVTDFPLADYSTAVVAAQTVRFLERFGAAPFAAWISIPDPHSPYEVPVSYARRFDPAAIELPPSPEDEFAEAPERNRVIAELLRWPQESRDGLKVVVATYFAMIRFIDDQIATVLASLDRLGLRDRTIVVFCADHGDFAGEHGMMGKGGVFYDCLTRVPLIVDGPGLASRGRRVGDPVSLIDVLPSVLHLQGLRPIADADGRLLPGATGAPPRAQVFSEYGRGARAFTLCELMASGPVRGHAGVLATLIAREHEGRRAMIFDGRWKCIHDPMGDLDELYDLENDPFELINLARDAEQSTRLISMRAEILAWQV